mmetsp:Transcript_36779/g.80718  ORF Transcript_36779/g.80718 Transcript_36779/m.80718 type:complete len:201 (+) Transcript_36779:1402-2004(+)
MVMETMMMTTPPAASSPTSRGRCRQRRRREATTFPRARSLRLRSAPSCSSRAASSRWCATTAGGRRRAARWTRARRTMSTSLRSAWPRRATHRPSAGRSRRARRKRSTLAQGERLAAAVRWGLRAAPTRRAVRQGPRARRRGQSRRAWALRQRKRPQEKRTGRFAVGLVSWARLLLTRRGRRTTLTTSACACLGAVHTAA